MSDQTPLTRAEKAAFAEMLRHGAPTECYCGDDPCDECSAAARSVVAAVRPIIESEQLLRLAASVKMPGPFEPPMPPVRIPTVAEARAARQAGRETAPRNEKEN